MRIGIVGLGSIGRKHAQVLTKLGVEGLTALRSGKGALIDVPEELSHISQTSTFKEFSATPLDGVIICTPTSFHAANLMESLALHVPILVEKPISGGTRDLREFEACDTTLVKVAYCLRFHPIFLKIKEILESGKLGSPLKMSLTVGQYLPDWHPYTHYQREYYSRKELGGGALRTLSHEIDVLLNLAGPYNSLTSSIVRLSNLEIDVEDNVVIIGSHTSGCQSIVEMDYLAVPARREGRILCQNGEISYNVIKSTLSVVTYGSDTMELSPGHDDMYENQGRDFLAFIQGKQSRACTFEEGSKVIEVIEQIERASTNREWVTL